MWRAHHQKRAFRTRGAAAVELAVSLPILLVVLLGSIEMGRAVMTKHVLEEAARAGCRVAVVDSSTKQDVLDVVQTAMELAGMSGYDVVVTPDPPTDLGPFEAVTVKVTIPYSQVAWFDAFYMSEKSLEGVCVMPAEAEGDTPPDITSGKKNKKDKKNKKNKKAKKAKKTEAAKKT
ncbi:MAG TPA: TadE/TadG family type IV pilus assembly protein [Pirellulaceae bacterium]|nr:TadE/TadG family type IV pilus assembly protein [Pirellulaceae bacterium]